LPWGQEYHRYDNKSIIMVKYNTNHSTSYQPNRPTPDTKGQNSNTTAKPPADHVGAPIPHYNNRHPLKKMKSIHIIPTTGGKKYGAPTGENLNRHLPTHWTLHQKHKIDTTSFLRKKWRSIHNLTLTINLRPYSYMGY
jgi:hypothetical protein